MTLLGPSLWHHHSPPSPSLPALSLHSLEIQAVRSQSPIPTVPIHSRFAGTTEKDTATLLTFKDFSHKSLNTGSLPSTVWILLCLMSRARTVVFSILHKVLTNIPFILRQPLPLLWGQLSLFGPQLFLPVPVFQSKINVFSTFWQC